MRLSTFLRDKRRERGWSQKELCRRAGLTVCRGNNMVSAIEQERISDNVKTTFSLTIRRIGNALGCPQELLLLAGFTPDEPDTLNRLERKLARSIRSALEAGIDQMELAGVLREFAAS
ncbi:MAG: hypothetical protein AMXMBFR33_01800 [Candidatus Xenobia bacterium]